MYTAEPVISGTKKNGEAFYTLMWSPLTKADKYQVTLKVPAISGVYELYRMDERKSLNLLSVTHAWYGGLRSQIRAAIDPDATSDPVKKAELEDAELYFRYSASNSLPDILDVLWFLHESYFAGDVRVSHSCRYRKIHLNEKSPDNFFWLD